MFVVLNSSEIVFFLFTLHLSQRINKDVIIFIIIFIITINFFFLLSAPSSKVTSND